MKDPVSNYLAEIGRKGGRKSRRRLAPEQAREMVRVREARKAYRRFHALCFWFSPPDMDIGAQDVDWVREGLMRHGNREAWQFAERLCR